MVAMKDTKADYLSRFSAFEREQASDRRSWLGRLRRDAIDRFGGLGFPSLKDEEWRFTNLGPLASIPFELGNGQGHGHRPVLTQPASTLPQGVVVCSVAEALNKHRNLVEPHLARYADYKSHAFTALNTAFLHDGAFVYVPPGCAMEEPISLEFLTPASPKALVWHRRCLIVAGAGSKASIVESHAGSQHVSFTNTVTEVVLSEDAVLEYHLRQSESKSAFFVGTVQVHQDRGSRFTSNAFALGSAIARTDLNVVLDAERAECTLNGLFLGSGAQLIDNHTRIDHVKPHCSSHEVYKGILDEKAHGVFNGVIFVHPDAQKTDARQTSKTLLLSDEAVIDAKPQLEIYADDVKCTHGASIGQLDEEQVFYLRTRGIDQAAARRLLTYAFANDIIGRVRIDWLRAGLEKALSAPGEAT